MGRLFGTDGIRATAGEFPLDPSTIFKLGLAFGQLGMRRILIGRDTRASGVWIQRVLESAIRAVGGEPILVGVITTPGVCYLARTLSFDAGVVISASHNPFPDNGIKVFGHDGLKLSDQDEDRIEKILRENTQTYRIPSAIFENWECELTDVDATYSSRYAEHLKSIVPESLSGLKVQLDCAHGAGFQTAPLVFRELGADVGLLNVQPDGHNINESCGALHPERMMRETRESGASFGVAFDGDGDRAIFSDENGRLVDGDHVLLILARRLHRLGHLKTGCVVTTVMANLGLEIALRQEGLSMVRTKVGDRHVLDEMLKGNHSLGGEQSGHIIIREHGTTGDGIQTALKIAQVMKESRRSLSELCRGLRKLPQVVLNVPVREKRDFEGIERIRLCIQEVADKMGDRGRVLVRYSGTEPLLRIMVEGERAEEITVYAQAIAEQFREELED